MCQFRGEDIRKVSKKVVSFDPRKLQKGLLVSRGDKSPGPRNPLFRHAKHGVNNICFLSRRDRVTEKEIKKKGKRKEEEKKEKRGGNDSVTDDVID